MVMRASVCVLVFVLATPGLGFAQAGPLPLLRLREAIAASLGSGPELQAREDAVTMAEIQTRAAAAPFATRWTPSLSSGTNPGGFDSRVLGMTVSRKLPTGTDLWLTGSSSTWGMSDAAIRDTSYSLGFSQPLNTLFGGAAAEPLLAAKRAVASTRRQYDDARLQAVVATAEKYFAVVRASRVAEAGARALARALRLVEASKARAAAGQDTGLDVMRAELLASQSEGAAGDALEALASAHEQLNLAMGRPLDTPYDVSAEEAAWTDPEPGGAVDLAAAAIDRRVTVRDARARVDDAKRSAGIARVNLLPPLQLNVQYERHGLGAGDTPWYTPMNGWRVSVTSNYQLDRAAQAAASATADVALKAAQREAGRAAEQVAAEVRQAGRATVRADAAAILQRRALDVAQRQVRLAQLRYERGLADNFAVVDAENTLFHTESASIAADIERWLSRVRLERVSGTLDLRRFEP